MVTFFSAINDLVNNSELIVFLAILCPLKVVVKPKLRNFFI